MNFILLLIALLCSPNSNKLDLICEDKWIIDSRLSTYPNNIGDQVSLIHPDAKGAKEIELRFRYGGLRFYEDNSLKVFIWKQCGNDDRPDYITGKWQLKNSDDFILIEECGKWNGESRILSLSKDVLTIERVSP